jgi:hypothetical protein
MMRIILLFFIWVIAIPAHSNPYENVWYRWNTFQDSVDEKAMYLRCGYISDSGTFDILAHDFKIIKVKKSEYELFKMIDDNWQKLDAHFSDRKIKYKKNESVTTYNIFNLVIFELEIMYAVLNNLSSSGFYTPLGQTSTLTLKEMEKKFNKRFEILNKIEKSITIDFSTGKLKTLEKPYNKNDKNINQALIYKDKIDSKILDASTNVFVGLPKRLKYYVYNYKCLALKK